MAGNNVNCAHCLLPVRQDSGVRDPEGRVFCCNGCRDVFHLLQAEGLEEFYQRRKSWIPGPMKTGSIDVEAFKCCIKKEGNLNILDLNIGGIRCASCVWLIERFLKKQKGIISVSVNYGTYSASIVFDPEKTNLKEVLSAINRIGYIPIPATESGMLETTIQESKELLVMFGTGAFFSMQVMLLSVALYAGYFQGISPVYKKAFQIIAWILATPVVFYAGQSFLKGLWKSLLNRSPSMDTLVGLSSLSAYLYSVGMIFTGGEVYFDSSCMIVTIVLLGRYIEKTARLRSLKAMLRFEEIYPQKARLVRPDDTTEEVPVEEVKVGDIIEVLQSERIPLDGEIFEGITEIDESPLTGEALPVKKQKPDEVFAGTINLGPIVRVKVTRKASESLLKAVVKAVQNAQARKPPVQKVVDRVSGVFVTTIIVLAVGTFFYWEHIANMKDAILNAVAVLVVACPCALGLATPLVLLKSTTACSERGIIIKDTSAFEKMPSASVICFDKTGTLTDQSFRLKRIAKFGYLPEEKLLDIVWAVESKTTHPLKKVFYRDRATLPVEKVELVPGRGVKAMVMGSDVVVGSGSFLSEIGIPLPEIKLSSKEMSVFMAVDGRLEAVFFVEAPIKVGASEVVRFFKARKLWPVILSGDRKEVVSDVARSLDIDESYGKLTPFKKADFIRKLMKRGKRVIMVGDGINDAPALKEAHLGIASHNATDLAVEAAEVVLLRGDISLLVELYKISKKTLRKIKENLFWAFGYNMFTIPLAITGKLHPIVSAILMVISSIFVTINSLRIE